ncbi:hypothetical protein EDD21DRAFT_87173 [Dissophora ornata]|nr:hypothetical protein EDD21DRAFT_87173 [Dissophora ornata]
MFCTFLTLCCIFWPAPLFLFFFPLFLLRVCCIVIIIIFIASPFFVIAIATDAVFLWLQESFVFCFLCFFFLVKKNKAKEMNQIFS